jgi:hypothetical protein
VLYLERTRHHNQAKRRGSIAPSLIQKKCYQIELEIIISQNFYHSTDATKEQQWLQQQKHQEPEWKATSPK